MKFVFLQTILGALMSLQLCRGTDALDTWTRLVSGTSANLNGVAFGRATFVAVGDNGIVTTATNGTDWTVRMVGTTLYSVAFGADGRFVAVGERGATFASPDGVDWTPGASGTTNAFRGITYGGNQFVVVGRDGAIFTSPDGTQWTGRNLGTNNHFLGVAEDTNDVAVAVGYSLSNEVSKSNIFTSPDNTNWAQTFSGSADRVLFGVARGNGQFAAVESYVGHDTPLLGYYGAILTSSDGSHWIQTYSTTNQVILLGVCYGNGLFVAPGWNTRGFCTFFSSADGTHWTTHNSGSSDWLDGIGYGNGRFVSVGIGGRILQSGAIVRLGPTSILPDGPAQFVLTGPAGQDCLIDASPDLTSWAPLTNVFLTNGTSQFIDPLAANFSNRFYRAIAR